MKRKFHIQIPGILFIDTPGHKTFSHLRKLGISLCNIAIIIIDIHKGPLLQTIESIKMLEETNTLYIIALNKIDKIYGWKTKVKTPFKVALKRQSQHTKDQFDKLARQNFIKLAELCINAKLYYDISNFKKWVPMVPISAKTQEGFSDLIAVLVKMSEKYLKPIIQKNESEPKGIVVENRFNTGKGNEIDIILTDGNLKIGDNIYIQNNCIKIRSISTYVHSLKKWIKHDQIFSAFYCTVSGTGIKDTVPGSRFSTNNNENDNSIKKNDIITSTDSGVYIQSNSIGSLQALSQIMKQENIPVCGYSIGDVKEKNVFSASRTCRPKVIIAFNTRVTNEAMIKAKEEKVIIFESNVIYQVMQQFEQFYNRFQEQEDEHLIVEKKGAVFPCVLSIEKGCVFRKKNPLLFSIKVKRGTLKLNTPLSVFKEKIIERRRKLCEIQIGTVSSMRNYNDQEIISAEKGDIVIVEITNTINITFGRQITEQSILYSKITRKSLDCLKKYFSNQLSNQQIKLLIKLKSVFSL